MLEEYLSRSEGKTLEFKENTRGLQAIVKTVVAFANSSGGTIIIGVKDRTKDIVGITNALEEEEKLANVISDSIFPLLIPDIEIHSFRNKELLVLNIPHVAGPYYIKSEGPEKGVYVRFGSTNRKADSETISSLKLFATNKTYDELPYPKGDLDQSQIQTAFGWVNKYPTEKTCEMLGIYSNHNGNICPSIGGVLLFSMNRVKLFPDSMIRCARFKGSNKEKIIDQTEIFVPLPFVISEVIAFIEKNTRKEGKIGPIFREDVGEYPPYAIREALTNALLHSDYSMTGCHIQIAIFDDRIEFTNPGGLPFGQTIQKALQGFSRLRNRVIGRVFKELNLIEQWGSGLQRILAVCERQGLQKPLIEEMNNQFKLTLYSTRVGVAKKHSWESLLIEQLKNKGSITPKEAADLWNITTRAARSRLKKMVEEGVIHRIASSEKDPKATFILSKGA